MHLIIEIWPLLGTTVLFNSQRHTSNELYLLLSILYYLKFFNLNFALYSYREIPNHTSRAATDSDSPSF